VTGVCNHPWQIWRTFFLAVLLLCPGLAQAIHRTMPVEQNDGQVPVRVLVVVKVATYFFEANGNVTALINTNQVVVARYIYDPLGNLLASSGGMADINLYRFNSKEAHENSGLVYYGQRFYEPRLQRWLNHEPKGEDGGINLFRFWGGDPINGKILEGRMLSSVEFVHDYVQLWFDGPCLSVNAPFTILAQGIGCSKGDSGSAVRTQYEQPERRGKSCCEDSHVGVIALFGFHPGNWMLTIRPKDYVCQHQSRFFAEARDAGLSAENRILGNRRESRIGPCPFLQERSGQLGKLGHSTLKRAFLEWLSRLPR
jgi:RHS repeat-associated protein